MALRRVSIGMLVLLAGCSAARSTPEEGTAAANSTSLYDELAREKAALDARDAAASQEAKEQAAARLARTVESLAPLHVILGSQTTDGGVMRMRGSLQNPHAEKVKGVRLIMHIASHAGPGAEDLEQLQRQMDVTIPPGDTVPLRWDVESMYFGSGAGFGVEAYAIQLGERQIPPPPGWKE